MLKWGKWVRDEARAVDHEMDLKAILRDVMGEDKITFHFFSSYNYVMTLVVTVL